MQLVNVLKENMVFLDFKADNKDQAIEKLIASVADTGVISEPDVLKDALFEREKLGTTGVGGGIAMPHARSASVKDLTVAFFRADDGIDFNAVDSKPVNIIFMLLAPVSSGGAYLKLLAKISRLLRSDDFRTALMEASSPTDIMKIIEEYD